jgi:hypothetical protein
MKRSISWSPLGEEGPPAWADTVEEPKSAADIMWGGTKGEWVTHDDVVYAVGE